MAPFVAAMVFWVAGFTDWLDGMLARKLGQTSRFGAFIDPVADKVLVATALILITEHYHSIWITIPAVTMMLAKSSFQHCVSGWQKLANEPVSQCHGLAK